MSFRLTNLPAPDADFAEQWEAADALAKAYAADVGLSFTKVYRDLALERIKRPDRPSLPTRQGWSALYPHLADEPGWQSDWARDDSLRRSTEDMTRKIHSRKAAEQAEREREAGQAERERKQAELAELTADLRRRYFSLPGVTEQDFAAALPRLIDDERVRLMANRQTLDDEALALARQRIRL